jgi:hypothetical protein
MVIEAIAEALRSKEGRAPTREVLVAAVKIRRKARADQREALAGHRVAVKPSRETIAINEYNAAWWREQNAVREQERDLVSRGFQASPVFKAGQKQMDAARKAADSAHARALEDARRFAAAVQKFQKDNPRKSKTSAVKAVAIETGIGESTGWGYLKLVDENTTPESVDPE